MRYECNVTVLETKCFEDLQPVSYTHLDVYKRQAYGRLRVAKCSGGLRETTEFDHLGEDAIAVSFHISSPNVTVSNFCFTYCNPLIILAKAFDLSRNLLRRNPIRHSHSRKEHCAQSAP